MQTDSLWHSVLSADRFALVPEGVDTTQLMRAVDPSVVFGSTSELAHPVLHSAANAAMMTSPGYFHLIVCALFVMYCIALIAYPVQTVALLKTAVNSLHTEKMLLEPSRTFISALHFFTMLGLCGTSALVVRLGDAYGLNSFLEPQYIYWAMPVVVVVMLGIGLYQWLVLYISGELMLNRTFIQTIWYLKGILFSLATLIITPPAFLYMLNYSPLSSILYYIIIGASILLYLLWIFKSYRLFVVQNFSILHWILYLCAVEIFPLSFLLLLATR